MILSSTLQEGFILRPFRVVEAPEDITKQELLNLPDDVVYFNITKELEGGGRIDAH